MAPRFFATTVKTTTREKKLWNRFTFTFIVSWHNLSQFPFRVLSLFLSLFFAGYIFRSLGSIIFGDSNIIFVDYYYYYCYYFWFSMIIWFTKFIDIDTYKHRRHQYWINDMNKWWKISFFYTARERVTDDKHWHFFSLSHSLFLTLFLNVISASTEFHFIDTP